MTEQPPILLQDPETERSISPVDRAPSFFETERGRKTALWLIGGLAAVTVLYGFFYFRLARMVDARLSSGAFSDTVNIFTAPRVVRTGDALTQEQVVAGLRRSGYSVARGNTLGWYHVREHAVEIF